jgi:membrane peptidoglycan carboxypeptidase
MPSIINLTGKRHNRRYLVNNHPLRKAGLGCGILISLFLALMGITIFFVYINLSNDLPHINAVPALFEPPGGKLLNPTQLYDRTGDHIIAILQNPAADGWEYIRIAPINEDLTNKSGEQFLPNSLISATLAISDPDYRHFPGLLRTGFTFDVYQTLSQELVSNFILLDQAPGIQRSLQEWLLGVQITTRFGREKVLEWFLNHANYGRMAYGVDAAARVYFDKSASELDLSESALLAGITQTPEINPIDAPKASQERAIQVLQAMFDQELISLEQARQAKNQITTQHGLTVPSSISEAIELKHNLATTFTNLVLEQLEPKFKLETIERGGLKIITTLDYNLQNQINCLATLELDSLQLTKSDTSQTYDNDCDPSNLLHQLSTHSSAPLNDLNIDAAVIDPQEAQIIAITSKTNSGLDARNLKKHPLGSLSTPLIYITAFTRGMSPGSLVWDIPDGQITGGIENLDGIYHGPIRLRTALSNDYLIPAQKIFNQVGSENVTSTAVQLGLTSLESSHPANSFIQFLNTEVDLLEISQVFGVFANQGILSGHPQYQVESSPNTVGNKVSEFAPLKLSTVLRVDDRNGQHILDWDAPTNRPVITSQLAYLITDVLSNKSARESLPKYPNLIEPDGLSGEKIGRTFSGKDGWTVGFSSELVVGVWVGTEKNSEDEKSDHINNLPEKASRIWSVINKVAHEEITQKDWIMPPGIIEIEVCDPSGLLPTKECPNIVREIFLEENVPTQTDTLFQSEQINRDTNKLATVLTPHNLIEDFLYLNAPPEATEWAVKSGYKFPPKQFDSLPEFSNTSPYLSIESPSMYDVVKGKVPIYGSAIGEDTTNYRVRIGQGLNPKSWFQIGENFNHPVNNGLLRFWDTEGHSGLYAIQLILVREDHSVETASVLVTVDNQPPIITIPYPRNGQEVIPNPQGYITLQTLVEDNLGIQSVAFYLDNVLLVTLDQPPYAWPWPAQAGEHNLRIHAVDLAGNISDNSTTFFVNK